MIKKILLILLILIVLVIGGVVALFLFVDPNNFKGFISSTVKEKTGYELTIEGNLRWHIWPQISILTDAIRLEDTGAKKPILTAGNMRLDVELMPLFSKELIVKNVLIKSAVINITDESKGDVAKGNKTSATVNQTTTEETVPKQTNTPGWSFVLNQLDIKDSSVIYQQNKDLINFRNINIAVQQKEQNNVALAANGNINRDQQNFAYTLSVDVNLAHFPQTAKVVLNKFSYDYNGVGVPSGQLKGDIKATLNYQQTPFTLDSKDFRLVLNGNVIDGQLTAKLDKKPYFEAIFQSDKLDLTPFLSDDEKTASSTQSTQTQPVVTTSVKPTNELAFLQNFDAKFKLNVKEVVAKKFIVNNVVIDANNQDGQTILNKVNLDIADGHILATGRANGKQAVTAINLDTKITALDLGILFNQLDVINNFSGTLNAHGDIATNTIMPANIAKALRGQLAMIVNNAKVDNFNIQRIIQTVVSQYSKEPVTDEQYEKYTELHEISANAKLANGYMTLSSLKALSSTLDITGAGRVGLVNKDVDLNLNVRILSGWNGASKTINKLQQVMIPLTIYGPFTQLHYRVDADKVFKNLLNSELKNGLNKLKERLSGSNEESTDNSTNSSTSDRQEVKDILGGLLNKIK